MRIFFTAGLSLCLLFLFLTSSQAQDGRKEEWAKPLTLPPVENFYEVAPGIYRSAQPNAEAMKALEKFGIRTVINMRAYHNDNAEAEGTSLILRRVPINTWSIKESQLITVLRMLKIEERPILLHCQHGADRTGLVMALYRMLDQGWTREQALEELQDGGYGHHSIWMNIPRYLRKVDIEALRQKIGTDLYPAPGLTAGAPSGE